MKLSLYPPLFHQKSRRADEVYQILLRSPGRTHARRPSLPERNLRKLVIHIAYQLPITFFPITNCQTYLIFLRKTISNNLHFWKLDIINLFYPICEFMTLIYCIKNIYIVEKFIIFERRSDKFLLLCAAIVDRTITETWSQLLVESKDNKVRVCLDPRMSSR